MKVLHVIFGLEETMGGPAYGLTTLARAQAARGDDVVVLPCSRCDGPLTLESGSYGNLRVHEPPTRSRLLWYNGALRRVVRELARDRDIVHVHGSWRYHLLAAASAARAYGIPYIIRPYGNLGAVSRGQKSYRKRIYLELFERRVYYRAAGIHCCSSKERDEMAALQLRARRFIVPQPLETSLLEIETDTQSLAEICPGLNDEQRLLVFVGRIHFIKRLDWLVAVFVRLADEFPTWRLVMAGPHEDTEFAQGLQQAIQAARLGDRIFLPGPVRGAVKAALLERADLFAQPSMHENFGISLAEALMFGVPGVVASSVALAPEVAAAGAGLSWDGGVEELEAALRQLMRDDDGRRRCSDCARELAQRFRPEVVANLLDREYQLCLGDAG
ncbi:MAG: glycosyltransferase [Planctomycetota bacterium]